MTAVDDALRRDAEAQCVDPSCHQTSADRRVLANEVRLLREQIAVADRMHAADLAKECGECQR